MTDCAQVTSPLSAPSPCLLMEVVMVSACLSIKASATFCTVPFYISAAVINHPPLLSKGEVRPVILRTSFLPMGMQSRGVVHLPAPRSGAVGHWEVGTHLERGAMPEGVEDWDIKACQLTPGRVHFIAMFAHCLWKPGWFVSSLSGAGSWESGNSIKIIMVITSLTPIFCNYAHAPLRERMQESERGVWMEVRAGGGRNKQKKETEAKTLLPYKWTNAFERRQLKWIIVRQKIKWLTCKGTSSNAPFITQSTSSKSSCVLPKAIQCPISTSDMHNWITHLALWWTSQTILTFLNLLCCFKRSCYIDL